MDRKKIKTRTGSGIIVTLSQVRGFVIDGPNIEYDSFINENGYCSDIYSGLDIDDLFEVSFDDFPDDFKIRFFNSSFPVEPFNYCGIKKNQFGAFIIFGILHEHLDLFRLYELFEDYSPVVFFEEYEEVIRGNYKLAISDSTSILRLGDSLFFEVEYFSNEQTNLEPIFLNANRDISKSVFRTKQKLDKGLQNQNRYFLKTEGMNKNVIRQYLLYFQEFVLISQNIKIDVNVRNVNEGVELIIDSPKDIFGDLEISLRNYLTIPLDPDPIRRLEYITIEREEENMRLEFVLLKKQVAALTEHIKLIQAPNGIFGKNQQIEEANLALKPLDGLYKFNVLEIKNKISKGELGDVFQTLKNAAFKDKGLFNDIVLIESQYNRILREKRRGTINLESFNLGVNSVSDNLLNMIDDSIFKL